MTQASTHRPRGLVFTDLDGTLLDHESYSWDAAAPALDALKGAGVPVVLASSKTAAEIAALHAALGLGDTPAIVENGAGLFRPGGDGDGADDGEGDHVDNQAYRHLRRALEALPKELRVFFRGFGDMSTFEVAEITGLSRDAAARARCRQYSEPGAWMGDAATRDAFLAALEADGIAGRRGGRFLTLSHGATKADRMAEIAAALGADTTLALGDAPNDVEMLEAADAGVIVKNDHAPPLPPLAGEAAGRILRTEASGPTGWNRAVLDWLATITTHATHTPHGGRGPHG